VTLLTADHVYRGREYRLAEPWRENGAKVTYLSPTSLPMECSVCGRIVRHGTKIVLASIYGMHPGCAVLRRYLVPLYRTSRELALEHANLAYDALVAIAHPHPRDLGAVQQRAWMSRLDAALIREVAF
jgi:hypothetical protein